MYQRENFRMVNHSIFKNVIILMSPNLAYQHNHDISHYMIFQMLEPVQVRVCSSVIARKTSVLWSWQIWSLLVNVVVTAVTKHKSKLESFEDNKVELVWSCMLRFHMHVRCGKRKIVYIILSWVELFRHRRRRSFFERRNHFHLLSLYSNASFSSICVYLKI